MVYFLLEVITVIFYLKLPLWKIGDYNDDAQNWMTKKNVTSTNVATKCDKGTLLVENQKAQNRSLATTQPFRD